jgi:hypothetical protein
VPKLPIQLLGFEPRSHAGLTRTASHSSRNKSLSTTFSLPSSWCDNCRSGRGCAASLPVLPSSGARSRCKRWRIGGGTDAARFGCRTARHPELLQQVCTSVSLTTGRRMATSDNVTKLSIRLLEGLPQSFRQTSKGCSHAQLQVAIQLLSLDDAIKYLTLKLAAVPTHHPCP